jgi:hypothetical protein
MWKESTASVLPHEEEARESERGAVSGVFAKSVAQPPQCAWELANSVAELSRLTDRAERNRVLAELGVRTVEQLSEEEGPGGLWDLVCSRAPRLWPRVRGLREEHDGIRVLASTLFRYARTDAPQAMVHMTLERLVDAVRLHVENEAELLQDALLTDLGEAG